MRFSWFKKTIKYKYLMNHQQLKEYDEFTVIIGGVIKQYRVYGNNENNFKLVRR